MRKPPGNVLTIRENSKPVSLKDGLVACLRSADQRPADRHLTRGLAGSQPVGAHETGLSVCFSGV